MATAQHPAATKLHGGVQPLRAGKGNSFLWRKLQSLLGVAPLGEFLLDHILHHFATLKPPAADTAQVTLPTGLPPVLAP